MLLRPKCPPLFMPVFPHCLHSCTKGIFYIFNALTTTSDSGRPPTLHLQQDWGTGYGFRARYRYQMLLRPKCPPLFMPVPPHKLTSLYKGHFFTFSMPDKTTSDSGRPTAIDLQQVYGTGYGF